MKTSRQRLEDFYWRPGFLLRRAHQLAVNIFEEECSVQGLTAPQYAALTVLASAQGIDQSAMSRALGFDRVTALHLVRGLQLRGLVAREPAVGGRRLRLSLTPEGERVLAEADGPVHRAMQRQLAPLSEREQSELLALLRKLCAGLDGQARTPLVPPGLGASAQT